MRGGLEKTLLGIMQIKDLDTSSFYSVKTIAMFLARHIAIPIYLAKYMYVE